MSIKLALKGFDHIMWLFGICKHPEIRVVLFVIYMYIYIIHIHVYTCIYTYVYMYVYIQYIYVYIMYIYIHKYPVHWSLRGRRDSLVVSGAATLRSLQLIALTFHSTGLSSGWGQTQHSIHEWRPRLSVLTPSSFLSGSVVPPLAFAQTQRSVQQVRPHSGES